MTDKEKDAIENIIDTSLKEKTRGVCTISVEYLKSIKEYIQTQQEVINMEDKVIEEIVNTIVGDKQLLSRICNKHIKKSEEDCEKQNLLCDDCIKMYLLNKVEKENKDEQYRSKKIRFKIKRRTCSLF